MRKHTVRQGECLSSIAAHYRFGDTTKIWNHPENAELRSRRGDGHVIYPGDVIVIPDRGQKTFTLQAGETLEIRLSFPERKLSLLLVDGKGAALGNADYRLQVGSKDYPGKTDAKGLLEVTLPANTQQATLIVGERTWDLEIGHLNPVFDVPENDVSGVEGILKNLGLYAENVCGFVTDSLRDAVRIAQRWLGHAETGEADTPFKKDLLDVYHGRKPLPPPVVPPRPSELAASWWEPEALAISEDFWASYWEGPLFCGGEAGEAAGYSQAVAGPGGSSQAHDGKTASSAKATAKRPGNKGRKGRTRRSIEPPPPWNPAKVTVVEKLPETPPLCSTRAKAQKQKKPSKHPVAPGVLNTLGLGRKWICEACKTHANCLNNDYNFMLAVAEMAERLKGDASNFMAIMHFETGHTYSPSIVNDQSGATGLIQFMFSTAKALGTSTADLRKMCRLDQLRYVERYFRNIKAQFPGADFRQLSHVVLAVFEPIGLRPDRNVLGVSEKECEGKPAIYIDRKGAEIEVTDAMREYYEKHGKKSDTGVLRDKAGKIIGVNDTLLSHRLNYDGKTLLVTPHMKAVFRDNHQLSRNKPGFILRDDYANILSEKIVPGCGKKSCEKAAEMQKLLASGPAEYLIVT